jgi:hypothetical protein
MALFSDGNNLDRKNEGVLWASDTYSQRKGLEYLEEVSGQYKFPFMYDLNKLTPAYLENLSPWIRRQLDLEMCSITEEGRKERQIEGFRGKGGDIILPDRTTEFK